jgi:hypothetical protein
MWAGLIGTVLLLGGCTIQTGLPGPEVIAGTPVGPVPLVPQVAAAPPPAPPGSLDGEYAGVGTVLSTGGGLCIRPLNIAGFVVRGDAVRYGRFSGTIAPNAAVQMIADGDWIVGQFQGPTFRGELDVPGVRDQPGCSYLLNLARTGP